MTFNFSKVPTWIVEANLNLIKEDLKSATFMNPLPHAKVEILHELIDELETELKKRSVIEKES